MLIILFILSLLVNILVGYLLYKAIQKLNMFSFIHEMYEDLYFDLIKRHNQISKTIKTFDEEYILGEDNHLKYIVMEIHNIQYIINTFNQLIYSKFPQQFPEAEQTGSAPLIDKING